MERVATTHARFKAIKTLGTRVAWASLSVDFLPVHLISIEPQNPSATRETIERLLIAIDGVLEKLPTSRFIIAGDLNEQREIMDKTLSPRGFGAAIPNGTPTHKGGNHLD